MKKIIPFLKPYRAQLLLAVLLSAASTLCELLLPTIMSDILDKGVYLADLSYILRCCGRMLIVALISLGTVLGGAYLSAQVVAGCCTDLRETVFNRVNNMSFEEFSSIGTSALLSRATHDIGNLSWVASMLSGSVVTIPVLFLGGVLLAMRKDAVLALIMLVFVPVVFIIVTAVGRKIEPLWVISDSYVDKQNDIVRERLHGIRVIRAFNSEPREHKRIDEATHVMADNIIHANVSMGLVSPLTIALMNMAAVLIVWIGGWRMENGLSGVSGFAVKVEVYAATGMPALEIIGLPDASVKESRDRVSAAIVNSGFTMPISRLTVNLAPADQRKEGPAFDLPIAISILMASGQLEGMDLTQTLMLGELSLDGSLHPVRGALPMVISASEQGIVDIILPEGNAEEVACIQGLRVYPASSLRQVVNHLKGREC